MVEVDVIALSPEMQRLAGELGAVVGSDGVGKAVGLGERIEHGSHRRTADGGIHVQGQALTGEVVHERQAAKAASAGKLVVNEVHAPALVGGGGLRQGHPCDGGELSTAFAAQGKPFLAVKPFGALVIDDEPFGLEHGMQDGRTPARLACRPVPQAFAQRPVVGRQRLVLERGAVPSREPADPALRKPKALSDLVHGRSACLGLQDFFARSSLSTIASSA